MFFLQAKCLIIFMLDDFHNIHGVKVPTKLKTSKVCHMASCLTDVHQTVPAVKPTNTLHRNVTVCVRGKKVSCPGGIGIEEILEIMTKAVQELGSHFLDSLPSAMQDLKPEALRKCLKTLR